MNKLKKILKDKDRRRGIIGTILVHLFLLVALLFLALRTPLPLPGEEGVEVNFGYDDQGYGDVQSETPAPVVKSTLPPRKQQKIIEEPKPVVEPEKIVTQDVEEAPAVEEKIKEEPKKVEKKPEKVPEEKKEPEPVKEIVEEKPVDSTFISEPEKTVEKPVDEPKPVVNTKALYKGSSKTSKQGANQGVKQGAGDMGKPQGYKDSDKYNGRGGEGNGISFSLVGRGSKDLKKPSVGELSEEGTVVVNIWVDRNGKVVNAQITKGTEVTDQKLRQIAVDAAKNSIFTVDQSALELQRGTITYTYKRKYRAQ